MSDHECCNNRHLRIRCLAGLFMKCYLMLHALLVCLETQARDARDNFFTTLGRKVNAKLGGTNIQFEESLFDSKEVMVVGANVNHPPENGTKAPSIAAVVSSVDGSAVSRYIARFSHKKGRTEEITKFGKW
ncbi:argonaute 2-like protein [Tanacetum coccineum]